MKPTVRLCSIFLGLILSMCATHAQYVDYGADPSTYRWNIVRTNHYRLIYPRSIDSLAQRYASLLETIYPHVKRSIGGDKEWLYPVVLHPGNMLSNGMVSWTPRRMELLTTPSSSIGAQPWDQQLTLHESRHVMQLNKLISGPFKVLYYLIGEQTAGLAAWLVPTWFLEGDAVATETALSNTGRGRLPEFTMVYRTQLETQKKFSFDKWYLGSYKHYTSDKYALGYNVTAFARMKYGNDFWDKVTGRYSRKPYQFPPFSNAVKYYSGGSTKRLYEDAIGFLQNEWNRQEADYQASGFRPDYLTPEHPSYTSYRYPIALDDGSIVMVKSGFRDLTALVSLQGGREKRLTYVGNINSPISHAHGRIYWSENVAGLRWTHQNYSVVKCYDMVTDKVHTLTPRQRYLSPTVNDSGIIAVSQIDEDNTNSIVLLTPQGEVMRRIVTPNFGFAKALAFTDDKHLAVLLLTDQGLSIHELNLNSEAWRTVLPPTRANITSPHYAAGKLYFESGLDGTNNIYRLDWQTGEAEQLTTARFGAFTPTLTADGKRLLFADYGLEGHRPAVIDLTSLHPKHADFANPYVPPLAQALSRMAQFNMDTVQIRSIPFEPKPYNKATHLFKIHSWLPFYFDVNDVMASFSNFNGFQTALKPGVTLLSQNSLNTAITQFAWYIKDGYSHGKVHFNYSGWLPVVRLSADVGSKAIDFKWETNQTSATLRGRYTNRTLYDLEAGAYIPFNFTDNHMTRILQPAVSYHYTNHQYQNLYSKQMSNYQYVLAELVYAHYRKMARRDLLPRWGFQAGIYHLFTPADHNNYGSQTGGRLTAYLPGLRWNDGLMLRAALQKEQMGDGFPTPQRVLATPRGYTYDFYTDLLYTASADYQFTWTMPDWSLGRLLYVKRLRSTLFGDLYHSRTFNTHTWTRRQSAGVEILCDCNVVQTEFPVSMGFRVMQPIRSDERPRTFELLFSTSF